jgi:hypothetical protein
VQKTRFAIGYHGTTKPNADDIQRTSFRESRRPGLWLGFGRYFFQDAPLHAFWWARYFARRETGDAQNAAVLWTEIDLQSCIDLTDRNYWRAIRSIWEGEVRQSGLAQLSMEVVFARLSMSADEIAALSRDERDALGQNYVDSQVMNILIQRLKNKMQQRGLDFTTVRAAFAEGKPVYESSWLWDRSAVIISVLEPAAMGPIQIVSEEELSDFARGLPTLDSPAEAE